MSRGTARSTMRMGRCRRARMAAAPRRSVMRGGARGAAHDDVGFGKFLVEPAQIDGIAFDLRRQWSAPAPSVRLAITMRLTPARCEMPRGEGDHLAGADHQSGLSAQIREHAPREAHRGGGEGDGIGADLGLRAHALGGGKRGLKQPIEGRARAAGSAVRPGRHPSTGPESAPHPSTMESSPEATLKACSTARCS